MIKKTMAAGLLILFVGYASCTTLFYHVHVVDGQIIMHSHPYADEPDTGNHTHTSMGFTTIAVLSVFFVLVAFAYLIGKPFILLSAIINKKVSCCKLEQKTTVLSLRGPPSF